jgi:hypothetical protein
VLLGSLVPDGRQAQGAVLAKKPELGPVETLALWLMRAHEGVYFKWLIARRLARLDRELGEPSDRPATLAAMPAAVEEYLDAGLNRSFADFPRAGRWYRHRAPTALDLNPKEAVDYVESKLK